MEAIQLELDLGDLGPGGHPLTDEQLPPAAHPCTPEGLLVDQNRVRFLEALYEVDGRSDPEHPHCGTYTGLAEAFCLRLGRELVNAALESEDSALVLLLGP
jgi:hypothetical protein